MATSLVQLVLRQKSCWLPLAKWLESSLYMALSKTMTIDFHWEKRTFRLRDNISQYQQGVIDDVDDYPMYYSG